MKWIILFVYVYTLFGSEGVELIHYDPFKRAKKIVLTQNKPHKEVLYEKKPKPLIVSAVFNNKAFINGRFYKQGDRIRTYRVRRIYKDRVVLEGNNKHQVILYILKKNFFQVKGK